MMKRAVPDRLRVVREGVGAGGTSKVPNFHRSVSGRRREMRPGGVEVDAADPVPVALAGHHQVAVRHGPELPGGIIRNSGLRETDVVATPPPFTHATRRLSCGRVDGVEAPRHRDDAIDANQKSWETKGRKRTPRYAPE